MKWDEQLARELKKRNNPFVLGPCTGEVISVNPYRIKVTEEVILEKEKLKFAARLLEYVNPKNVVIAGNDQGNHTGNINIANSPDTVSGSYSQSFSGTTHITGIITNQTPILKVGDLVILIPTTDMQKFYVIDKELTI